MVSWGKYQDHTALTIVNTGIICIVLGIKKVTDLNKYGYLV